MGRRVDDPVEADHAHRPYSLPQRPSKEARPGKRAILVEFHSFRDAFLHTYRGVICGSLHDVIPDVVLVPTDLGYPQQKRFVTAMRRLLSQSSRLQVLPALHGTKERNFESILGQGFVIPGAGNSMPVKHGSRHGLGIYVANLDAAWLSASFCDKPKLLVCAVLQSTAVHHALDAQVVTCREHIVPLFQAVGKRFDKAFHSKRRLSNSSINPKPFAVNVSWLLQLEHVLDRKRQGHTAASQKREGRAFGLLCLAGYGMKELLACGFKPEACASVYHLCSLGQLRHIAHPLRMVARFQDHSKIMPRVMLQWSFGAKTFERFCSIPQLRLAGFSAIDLKNAGCTPESLLYAGYSDAELHSLGVEFDKGGDLWEPALSRRKRKMSNRCMLLSQGVAACKQAGYSAAELKIAGFGVLSLKQAGFQIDEIMDSGFRPWQLLQYYDVEDWEAIGVTASDLRLGRCCCGVTASAVQLQRAGYTARFVVEAGYKGAELIDAGYSIESLESAGHCVSDCAMERDTTDSCCDAPESWCECDLFDDPDYWHDLKLSCLDTWLTKESREASRSRNVCKSLKTRRHVALRRLRELSCAEGRRRPRRVVARKFGGAPAKTLKASLMVLTS